MDPDVTWGNGSVCPLVVHHLADLQSVHVSWYDNIQAVSACTRSMPGLRIYQMKHDKYKADLLALMCLQYL